MGLTLERLFTVGVGSDHIPLAMTSFYFLCKSSYGLRQYIFSSFKTYVQENLQNVGFVPCEASVEPGGKFSQSFVIQMNICILTSEISFITV